MKLSNAGFVTDSFWPITARLRCSRDADFYVTHGRLWESLSTSPCWNANGQLSKCIDTPTEENLHRHNLFSFCGVFCATMSLQQEVEDAVAEERSGFFIGVDSDNGSEDEDHHQLILQKANALASENCLKEAIDWFSAAMRYGPVRPEHLSTFVDCVLRNFKTKTTGPDALSDAKGNSADDAFDCPSCRSFIGEPVTLACGHSYCKRCLQRRLLSKCKLCKEAVTGDERVNVILCGLLEKWFPEELKTAKTLSEVDELCRRRRYKEAVTLATCVIQRGKCCWNNLTFML